MTTTRAVLLTIFAACAPALFPFTGPAADQEDVEVTAESVIVQATTLALAENAVGQVGGEITHRLGIIRAVAARVTSAQRDQLDSKNGVRRVTVNRMAEAAAASSTGGGGSKGGKRGAQRSSAVPKTDYPVLIGADRLHEEGITGDGVTIAVLDSGIWWYSGIVRNNAGRTRIKVVYDAIQDIEDDLVFETAGAVQIEGPDGSGHGTHVAGAAVNSERSKSNSHTNGVAPDASLVVIKAFNDGGQGTYADVIRGLDWLVTNSDRFGVDVVNLSFSAPPQSHYWDDPLNQAVMAAWDAGIVVVASAGNTGPEAMTIGVPGNLPYVITVGAMSDAVTPDTPADDFLASFSAAGPTHEGFVKPELVAPGAHLVAPMNPYTMIAEDHWEFHDTASYFTMSGTSQAAAVVSGATALLLQAEPTLSPDDVKCRLMASARPAVESTGKLAYSVFQQGAGMVHAHAAVHESALGCANRNLDIKLDLAGVEHYGGRADRLPDGSYYLRGVEGDGFMWADGFMWGDGFMWADGFMWNDGFMWADGFMWNDGFLWSDASSSGFLWSDAFSWASGFLWADGYLWSDALTEPMSINNWVEQE